MARISLKILKGVNWSHKSKTDRHYSGQKRQTLQWPEETDTTVARRKGEKPNIDLQNTAQKTKDWTIYIHWDDEDVLFDQTA